MSVTFDDQGPFAEPLEMDERNRRLDALAVALERSALAPFAEMVRLTKTHPRNLPGILATLNALPETRRKKLLTAYKAQART